MYYNSYPLNTGEGPNFDYTVSTSQVRFLYRIPDSPEDILFVFRIDSIAQEEDETFSLELVVVPGTGAPPTGEGVFFRNILNMTIVDSDSKTAYV